MDPNPRSRNPRRTRQLKDKVMYKEADLTEPLHVGVAEAVKMREGRRNKKPINYCETKERKHVRPKPKPYAKTGRTQSMKKGKQEANKPTNRDERRLSLEIKRKVKEAIKNSDLSKETYKTIITRVSKQFPDVDMEPYREFIKDNVRQLL